MAALSLMLGARVPLVLALLLPAFTTCAEGGESDEASLLSLPSARKVSLRSLKLRGVAEKEKVSLAQAGARHQAQARTHQPKGPGWFGDFSQMESTYTDEGVGAYTNQDSTRIVEFGYDVGYKSPYKDASAKKAAWFDESPSAGTTDAWQTHPAGKGESGAWRNTFEGWVQDYKPAPLKQEYSGAHPAAWFDSSVLNYDSFGRRALPYPSAPRRLFETDVDGGAFLERAVNTTIKCADRNCTATTTLQAFDAATEEARNCRLNIGVHATDYDNDWSKEAIKDWTVNGYLVNSACDPQARGCNNSAWRPLYSCLNSLSVDHIIDRQGALQISGKVSRFVDECPYEGNLLSGVVAVTCMVRPIPPVQEVASPKSWQDVGMEQTAVKVATGSAKLRCAKQGCAATTEIAVDPQVAMNGGTCRMNVTLAQTDFDSPTELFEFLKLGPGGAALSLNAAPSSNPCNLRYAGTTLSQEQEVTHLVTDLNVTQEVLTVPTGMVVLSGKISDDVDECASDGNLLDATATILCEMP